MSFNFVVGQLVKVSPDVIGDSAKNDELLGDLGTPGLFKFAIWEIVKLGSDPTRGEIAFCRLTNPDIFKTVIPGVKEVKSEGEAILLLKDIIPANTKVTLDYIIESSKTNEEVIRELFVEREALKRSGLDKRHKQMRDNWKQIQILRGEISGPRPAIAGNCSVYLPSQRIRFELQPHEVPGNDEESIKKFKQFLSNKLRGERVKRRTATIETKVVFGNQVVEKQAGVYLKSRSLLTAYEEMMKTSLETDKKPSDPKATYVGIEIEFIYSGNYDILKELILYSRLHRHVTLKRDGSVHACHNAGQGYTGLEMTILCKNTEVESVMQRLDKVFTHPMIDAYVNRSCGLHVHLDARNRNVGLVYKNLVRIQSILRGAQPVGRLRNTHCRPNISDSIEENRGGSGGDRYWVVNGLAAYERHKSIEVRIHEGTINGENIFNWVSFLDAIASHSKEIPKNELKFVEDLVVKYDVEIPLSAIDYVDRRIEKFNSLSIVS